MSEYKKKIDKIVFSHSSLSQFCECPYAFFMRKIQGIKGDGNAFAEIGSFGHELCADYLSGKATLDETLSSCVDDFDDRVTYEISEASKDKKYFALCDFFASFDEDDFESKYEVLGVEKRFKWEIDGHKMVGIADLILKRKSDGKIILVDHKSSGHFLKKDGKPLKTMQESFEKYKHQMYMYADAMKKSNDFGCFPDYIVWNHFLDDGQLTIIPFKTEEYEETINWVVDTINKIYECEEFLPHISYIMCNQLCDYRDGYCEYMLIDYDEDD